MRTTVSTVVIHPPVKPDPRLPLRAWLANGCLVACGDRDSEPPRGVPSWLPLLALAAGTLIGWGLR